MRRKYSSKLARIGVMLCAFLLVACGLKVVDVTLSADEIEQGEEVTITSKLTRVGDGSYDWGNNKGIYLLYAIRVPSDWNDVETLKVHSNGDNAENNVFTFEESPAYSALSEFCYPQEGYKWIGFQTTDPVDLLLGIDEELFTSLTLRAGDATGEFHLDILSGCMSEKLGTPSDLLKEDGTLNLALAFGQKTDGGDADKKTLPDGTSYIGFSEYLVNASTISPTEKLAAENTLLSYTSTVGDVTYPISAGVDVGNALTDEEIAALQLNVKVNGDNSAVNEIEASENENAPVYNLQGVKVNDTTVPGIYVKNGKKFVVK